MHPTHLCIVARPMRTADRAIMFATVLLVVATGCDQLDGERHARVRRLMNPAFSPVGLTSIKSAIERIVAERSYPAQHRADAQHGKR